MESAQPPKFVANFIHIVTNPEETVYEKFVAYTDDNTTTSERNYFAIILGVVSGIFSAVAYSYTYKKACAALVFISLISPYPVP